MLSHLSTFLHYRISFLEMFLFPYVPNLMRDQGERFQVLAYLLCLLLGWTRKGKT